MDADFFHVTNDSRLQVRAGIACRPLMARTLFGNARYDCVLEYPVKTINLNDRHGIFQPDTGPVLWLGLDFDRSPQHLRPTNGNHTFFQFSPPRTPRNSPHGHFFGVSLRS